MPQVVKAMHGIIEKSTGNLFLDTNGLSQKVNKIQIDVTKHV
jgi:hypothetical protein